jgi:hypothetical protein
MKTELKALGRIIRFFAEVFGLIAIGYFAIIGLWAVFA